MIRRFIHAIIMPCKQATLYIEQQNAADIAFFQRIRLKAHLISCKWCRSYSRKVQAMECMMKKMFTQNNPKKLNNTELQVFKEKLKERLK